jgi:hypothetical protein
VSESGPTTKPFSRPPIFCKINYEPPQEVI